MNISKQEHLDESLQTHRMAHIDDLLKKYKDKRDTVKESIESKYGTNIYAPMNSGSFAKYTAINIKFDLDLLVPFKRDSFDTLEAMFDDIYDFLYEEYKDEATIRKQKVSIGIVFHSDTDGDEIDLDIVPARELNKDTYSNDNKLNLYVNSMYGTIQEKTYLQTNIKAQIDHITSKENDRKIIRLLKIWKNHNNESYKSFLLELLTIKAFDKEDISGNLWEKLKKVMEYIKDNVTQESFTLKDPGNSGNNVIDTLTSFERTNLSNTMDRIIKNIEDNEDYIKSYFPVNKDFEEEDDDKNASQRGYGLKTASVSASLPPNNTRFG
ncbi:hypothetical protein [uncultured Arcobacter sp.]|uniref:hypothetical protein n=1 Tax=uncultured Arcobacter sp. TaxID=165434 RepID=UPI00261071DF|nr:hypothetical protein [uncultured Arcobacter sp.]